MKRSRSKGVGMTRTERAKANVFRIEDPIHLIRECLKPPRNKNQMAFVGGSWSDSGKKEEDKTKDETYLMAQASNEVLSKTYYYSDDISSIDDLKLDIENEKLKEEASKLTQFEKSTHLLKEMLSFQKPSSDKSGLGFNSVEESSSRTKQIKFVKS
ncbi:hypothetical protein Tco_0735068 [Tanacetum coccineum]